MPRTPTRTRLRRVARTGPGRLVTGVYIAHTGWEKWRGTKEQAGRVHAMAAGAFPVLEPIPDSTFLRMLAVGEMATGAVLLSPLASNGTAGIALTGFSGALLTMYARTPAMHKPGSIWPTPAGIAVSKDSWMLAIGLGLIGDALTRRRRR
jgi:hypothetical protein